MKKILILLGNPETESLDGALAEAYARGARASGHQVTRLNVGEMHFDPILHHGYRTIQNLEPDLLRFQALVRECDHFVVVYPNWWCTMPALLKGLFDRAWLPGFAFNMRKDKSGKPAMGWKKLMKGKTARVIITTGSPPWMVRAVFGDFTNEIKNGILWFVGFKAKVSAFGPADNAHRMKCAHWIAKVEALGLGAK